MNYKKMLANDNVQISDVSPRGSGETEARSGWIEIKNLPFSFEERVTLIKRLGVEHKRVWLKTATGWGKARLFVSD